MDHTNHNQYRDDVIHQIFGSTDEEDAGTELLVEHITDGPEEDQNEMNFEEGPKPGMVFGSMDDLLHAYEEHGRLKEFSVTKRSSKNVGGSYCKYMTITCDRGRKSQSERKTKRIECPTRLNAVLRDGFWVVSRRVNTHNHALDPDMSRLMPSNRNLTIEMQRQLEANDIAGIRPCKSIRLLEVQNGGPQNVGCLPKDCRNFIESRRRLRLGEGDANAINKMFLKMQKQDGNFFYLIDTDEDGRLDKVLWVHSRCRAAYEEFHDVLSFDTTYLVNRYKMPFATMVGVNHHGQSILLGCALISNEDVDSFKWLFSTWLSAMGDIHPTAIQTDQCESIKGALRVVMPQTIHRFCLWHIFSKLNEKLKIANDKDGAKKEFKTLIFDSLTIDTFERNWEAFLQKYGLEDNNWLNALYHERQNWVPIYLNHTFWAGMLSTQRSESMHAFFDSYIGPGSSLKQFVEQYEVALSGMIQRELIADFDTSHKVIKCLTNFEWERQLQQVYTNEMFHLLQMEINHMIYCYVVNAINETTDGEQQDPVDKYKIKDRFTNNMYHKEIDYLVEYREGGQYLSCNCKKFESRGIPCCHILVVMTYKDIRHFNERYILRRWRKDVCRCYMKMFFLGCYPHMTEEYKRYKEVERAFQDCSDLCSDSQVKMAYLKQRLVVLKSDLLNWHEGMAPTNVGDQNSVQNEDHSVDVNPIHDPMVARSRGRPRSNRHRGRNESNQGGRGARISREGRGHRGGHRGNNPINNLNDEIQSNQPVVETQLSQINLNTNSISMSQPTVIGGGFSLCMDEFGSLVDEGGGGSWMHL